MAPAERPRTIRRWKRRTRRTRGMVAMVEAAAISPQGMVLALKKGDPHGEGLVGALGHDEEGEEEFVPGIDENKDRRSEDPRRRQGDDDAEEGLQMAAAVHTGRVFQLLGQFPEESRHDPDPQRQRQGDVRQDQPLVGIQPSKGGKDLPDWSGDGDLGEHGDKEQAAHDEGLVPEGDAGQGVAGEKGDPDGSRGGCTGDDDAVLQIVEEVVVIQGGTVEVQRKGGQEGGRNRRYLHLSL